MFDWFWLGAICNEVEAAREDEEQEQYQEPGVGQLPGSSGSTSDYDSGQDSRRLMKLPIQRMIELEEKFHVAVQGATADYDEEYPPQVAVRGELTAASGKLDEDLVLVASVYNAQSEVIGTGQVYFGAQAFVGFEAFELRIDCSPSHGKAVKVRLYVRSSV